MHYSQLTEKQRDFARTLVALIRDNALPERFSVLWAMGQGIVSEIDTSKTDGNNAFPSEIRGHLDVLESAEMLHIKRNEKTVQSQSGSRKNPRYSSRLQETSRWCTVTRTLYDAVDNDFSEPDTSFLTQLTPLADVTNLDSELKTRCLPILGAGAADPALWDSAVRTAGVILEERLRDVGGITDPSRVGTNLVNDVFRGNGTLAGKFTVEAEREGYRNLYAGTVGIIRNPSAHKLIDPTPIDGGATIVFIDLLLRKLEALR